MCWPYILKFWFLKKKENMQNDIGDLSTKLSIDLWLCKILFIYQIKTMSWYEHFCPFVQKFCLYFSPAPIEYKNSPFQIYCSKDTIILWQSWFFCPCELLHNLFLMQRQILVEWPQEKARRHFLKNEICHIIWKLKGGILDEKSIKK